MGADGASHIAREESPRSRRSRVGIRRRQSQLHHRYDEINRELTCLTLARDLPTWRAPLEPLFTQAVTAVAHKADEPRRLVCWALGGGLVVKVDSHQ
jgi:hypothetical protein